MRATLASMISPRRAGFHLRTRSVPGLMLRTNQNPACECNCRNQLAPAVNIGAYDSPTSRNRCSRRNAQSDAGHRVVSVVALRAARRKRPLPSAIRCNGSVREISVKALPGIICWHSLPVRSILPSLLRLCPLPGLRFALSWSTIRSSCTGLPQRRRKMIFSPLSAAATDAISYP